MLNISLALLLAAQPAPPPEDRKIIVVTGRRLADTEAALRACLARKCPPIEDIEASAAHAENLFVAGQYDEASRTLRSSIGRNGRHAAQLPVKVASLYRAHSRLSAHLGRAEQYRSSSYGITRSLKAGLPEDDPQVVAGRFEIAAMQWNIGQYRLARDTYGEVVGQARRIGRLDLARLAQLRIAWMDFLLGDKQGARQQLKRIADDRSPETRVARISAIILLSRIDRAAGKPTNTDALIAELRQAKLDKPVLLHAPPIKLNHSPIQEEGEAGNVHRLAPTESFEKKWVDVGFWVEADGQVRDVEILRSSGSAYWTDPLLASIKGRIYAPLNDPAGSYRVERHTYTSFLEARSGSRIKQRSANARIETLDLSAE